MKKDWNVFAGMSQQQNWDLSAKTFSNHFSKINKLEK